MNATKEVKITINMNIKEAEALMYCMKKVLTDGSHRDLLPDDKRTESALKSFVSEVRRMI